MAEEFRELRAWLMDQITERLTRLEQLSQERGEQMREHRETMKQLQRTEGEIVKRLDRIEAYFETLMNLRTFVVWATPIITFIIAMIAILWGGGLFS